MNLGDGLLLELENGKPKLILLNREEKVQKNPGKPSSRLPSVLSCRQPSRVDTHTPRTEEQPIRKQNALNGRSHQSKPGKGGTIVKEWGQTVTTSKTQENHMPRKEFKTNAKVKAAKPQNVRPIRKPEEPTKKVEPSNQSEPLKENEACLTNEQLQHILKVVQTNDYAQNTEENKTDSVSNETKGPEEIREEIETVNAPNKFKVSGGLLSWVEERPSEDRAALEAKKAQWKKDLDEQVALKQKIHRSAPPRLQREDDTESLVSVQSSISYKDLPAAIRSSLRVGEFAPMDEVELTQEQRQEQRRRWLRELDKQREESSERKRLEKLQQRQTEDQHLWASHFDSFQRPPLAPLSCSFVPPPCLSADRGETGLCSSLSQWEEVRGGVETNNSGGHTTRASHLRTMTSLLDPAEIEERERRRLKQLDQRRTIKLQVEERRRRREEEESRRKREEEEEERRVEQEGERLHRQYERDTQQERNKEQHPEMEARVTNCSEPELQFNTAVNQDASLEQEVAPTAVNHLRNTAVQTEEVHISETLDLGSCGPVPGLVPGPNAVVRAQVMQMLQMLHKGFGAEVYEPFTRTECPKKDEKRPEWNTQRPSRRFVPASQRYPEELQRQRQESRLRRQAQLLSLQRNPTNNPNNNTTNNNPTNNQNLLPNLSPTEPEQSRTKAHSRMDTIGQSAERGHSPVHGEAPDFLPYVRTDEVDMQPQHSLHTAPAPQLLQKTQRQQEIIRGLARLRQGLLQKQRELKSDLSCSHLDHDLWPVSVTATYQREL
ncbi:hypothetical protein NQD34_007676 [Periophthalmus magnuspinnatus]|nr:hypothetical protein NQD34_007676 [Periophthalmus magnuspinnatus]